MISEHAWNACPLKQPCLRFPSYQDLLLLRVSCQAEQGQSRGAGVGQHGEERLGRREGCRAGGGAAPHCRGDRDEVRVVAEPRWEAGEGGREGSASLQAHSSAHQRHCSSFIYLYSWLLPAQRMKTVFTERSSLLGSLGAQESNTSLGSILVSFPTGHTRKL